MSGEQVSAFNLLDSLKKSFGFGEKKPPEVPAVATAPPTVSPTETSAPADFTEPPEPIPTMTPPGESPATETPAPAVEFPVSPASGLPDWLQAGQEEAVVAPTFEAPAPETLAPLPTVEVQTMEVPVQTVTPEAQVESDPFATSREFNGYMETIRQFQEILAGGAALDSEGQKQALIAVARANSLLPKLPGEVLKSVLLMRAVASGNPRFGRNDFQLEMLAAMVAIKAGTAAKG